MLDAFSRSFFLTLAHSAALKRGAPLRRAGTGQFFATFHRG